MLPVIAVVCFVALAATLVWWARRRRRPTEPNVLLHVVHRGTTSRTIGVTVSCQQVRRGGRADHESLFPMPVTRTRRVA